jgi:hypothetical protein
MFRKLVSIAFVAAGLLGTTPALADGVPHEDHSGASGAEPVKKEGTSCCDGGAMPMHMPMHMHSHGQHPGAVDQATTERPKDISQLDRYPLTVPSDG